MGIQGVKTLEGRHWHQEVAAQVAHHPLDLPLVVALAGAPEPVLEPVVGLQLGEGPGALTASVAQDPGHRQLGVVLQDALGHSTQEGECRQVAVPEGRGGLRGVGLDEAAVAVGQVQDEAVGLALHSPDDPRASPKSHWACPGEWDRGTNISRDRRRRSLT